MTEVRMNKKNVGNAKKQFTRWELFLNNIVGVFAYNAAQSALGTHSPSTNAVISFVFLLALTWLGRKQFPELLKDLRSKKDKTEHENYFLVALESKHLGIKAMFGRYTVFVIGYSFLIFVAAANLISKECPLISKYVYGI